MMSLPVLIVGLLSALLTRLQIAVSARLQWAEAPRSDRWHRKPTPTSGGIAIFLACAAGYLLACRGPHPRIAIAAAALWIFGLIDDRRRLGPIRKVGMQIFAAALVVLGGTVFPLSEFYVLDVAAGMFWIVMITNAVNLIDNMDGLCAGVVIIICVFRAGLLRAEGFAADAVLYTIVAAAFAGFLAFNYHPARIFMGDCGSLPAGFVLGALALAGPAPREGSLLARFFCLALTFAYPIFDTAWVSIHRKMAGRPISMGGRDHTSHLLVSLGWSETRAVWILWGATAAGSGLGLLVYLRPQAVSTVAVLVLLAAGFCGMVLSAATTKAVRRAGT